MNRKRFSIGLGLLLSLFITMNLASAQTAAKEVISFPDTNLEAVVRTTLGLPAGEPITARKMRNLTELRASDGRITDLTGLEYATNLRSLFLFNEFHWKDDVNHNRISDVSPLANLTQLEDLRLDGNPISDISPLADLTQLTYLNLKATSISDISPISNLTQLWSLHFSVTSISDISPISNLTQLRDLSLYATPISDISPISNLTQLRDLELSRTHISDISPISNLTQLRGLWLDTTPISDISSLANLTQLTDLDLQSTNVLDISPLANLRQLTRLRLNEIEVSDISPLADLTQLTDLNLRSTNVLDISPLADLTQLKRLDISRTHISDISPLANLRQLTGLNLNETEVSDISPLTVLTQLIELDLQDCPLSAASYATHIPTIKANETVVQFDPLPRVILPQESGLVSLIYFRPNDHSVIPNMDAKIDREIKAAQRFYADEMERHGFGRKTFQFEMDANGNAVVHHVVGKFDAAYYHSNPTFKWKEDLRELVHAPKGNIAVYIIDVAGASPEICGLGGGGPIYGKAYIYCLNWGVLAHELGHAFGMPHDFRGGSYLMSYGYGGELSQCAARRFDVHHAFNPNPTHLVSLTPNSSKIVMHPPSLDSSFPNAIRLRFEVNHAYGLHQAMLMTEEMVGGNGRTGSLIGCQQLNREKSSIVEFVTTGVTPEREWVQLSVIDVHGKKASKRFPIDVPSLLPPPEPIEVVSFPDLNLRKAVREALNLSADEDITTRTMLWLRQLESRNNAITDLTGLEHAKKLRKLDLGGRYASGKGYVNSNTISDFTSLEKLTKLKSLNLSYMQGLDVSSFTRLTQLEELDLEGTDVLDVVMLAALTQLKSLNLSNTAISDVSTLTVLKQLENFNLSNTAVSEASTLAALTQLESLNLSNTAISDVSALAALKQLEYLNLRNTAISDVSPLTALKQLEYLNLRWNFIWDIFPLMTLAQLKGSRDWHGLYLEGNPLSYATVNIHVPDLQTKGVTVRFENRAHSALVRVSGDRQEGISGETLPTALVVKAQDAHWKPMSGVDIKFTVIQGNGILTHQTSTTDANGRAETHLTLGKSRGLNRVRVTATGITYPVTFTTTATEPLTQLAAAPQAPFIALLPEETVLLSNYPNPFNPETWIPYQLAVPANVTLTIYASSGATVRTLALGYQAAGIYQSKSRAAYWDGRNHIGEHVASGVYFYTLSAGDFTATRKLLIRK